MNTIREKQGRAENCQRPGVEQARVKNHRDDRPGLSALGPRIVHSYWAVAIVTLNSLILFACMELAATFAADIWKESAPVGDDERPRAHVSYYASQAWAKPYWQEFSLSGVNVYHPYVIWRRGPFRGSFINIDEDGVRLTPGALCGPDAYKVFVFGGSTIWGTGAPDWGTIPAYLQADLTPLLHRPVCVINFGESGFVSTQNVIQLLQALQLGRAPDVAIFYDGVNDAYAGYQSGRASHQNLSQIAAKFEQGKPPPPSFVAWVESSHSFQLLKRLVDGLREKPQGGTGLFTYKTMGIDPHTLSHSVVENYISNYEIVHALAQQYGFKSLFFWQPVITMGDKALTGEEQEMKSSLDPALVDLYGSVYRRVQQVADRYEDLYYMAQVFDKQKSLVWIDSVHVVPEGNRLVAQEMLHVIMERDPQSH